MIGWTLVDRKMILDDATGEAVLMACCDDASQSDKRVASEVVDNARLLASTLGKCVYIYIAGDGGNDMHCLDRIDP